MFDSKTAPINRLPFLPEHGDPTEYGTDCVFEIDPERGLGGSLFPLQRITD